MQRDTFDPDYFEPFLNRLTKNAKRLKKWSAKGGHDCYRLYSQDIPQFSFIIDRYDQNLVIYERLNYTELGPTTALGLIQKIGERLDLDPKAIHLKKKTKAKGGLQYFSDRPYQDVLNTFLTPIREGRFEFYCNFKDYIDTGLFLDHKGMRQSLQEYSRPNEKTKFLNLFSYTCTMSIPMAQAQASTTNVDLSNTYLKWGQKNYLLAGLEEKDMAFSTEALYEPKKKHHFFKMPVEDFLLTTDQKFDFIFLNPPTFSNSKALSKSFVLEKDITKLIGHCSALLRKGGKLLFSHHLKNFHPTLPQSKNLRIEDVTYTFRSQDFPRKMPITIFEITSPN